MIQIHEHYEARDLGHAIVVRQVTIDRVKVDVLKGQIVIAFLDASGATRLALTVNRTKDIPDDVA